MTEDNRNGEAQEKERTVKESNPEYENFQQALKQVLSVSKEELDKRRAEYEREKK